MKERRQLTIGIHRDKYDLLNQKKVALEDALGRKINWGTYMLILASQRPLDDSVAVLHDTDGDVANPKDYEEIPSWVTKEEVEEIVNQAAEKIIRGLIKLLTLDSRELTELANDYHKVHSNDCQINVDTDIHKFNFDNMNSR